MQSKVPIFIMCGSPFEIHTFVSCEPPSDKKPQSSPKALVKPELILSHHVIKESVRDQQLILKGGEVFLGKIRRCQIHNVIP